VLLIPVPHSSGAGTKQAGFVPQEQPPTLSLHQEVQAERTCTLCAATQRSRAAQLCQAQEGKPDPRLPTQTWKLCCMEGQEEQVSLGMASVGI